MMITDAERDGKSLIPVRFGLHLAGQMIVIGGFGRPEHSSSLVPKLSVVAPGLGGVTL